MQFSFRAFALGGLLTSVIASPVVDIKPRQEASILPILTDLFTTIQTFTGSINSTLAGASILDSATILADVTTEITSLTSAINNATTSISSLTPSPVAKRTADVKPRQLDELVLIVAQLELIVDEVLGTVTATIAVLGLSGLLVFLNPLTLSLGGLILAVEVVLDLLLLGVTTLLDGLLVGLGLTLGGLGL